MLEYIPQIVVTVCTSALTAVLASVWKKQKTILSRYQAVNDGIKNLLRIEIIRDCSHYLAKGSVPVYAMENILESYQAYHALGGNGTITKMVDELKKLPTGSGQEEGRC